MQTVTLAEYNATKQPMIIVIGKEVKAMPPKNEHPHTGITSPYDIEASDEIIPREHTQEHIHRAYSKPKNSEIERKYLKTEAGKR